MRGKVTTVCKNGFCIYQFIGSGFHGGGVDCCVIILNNRIIIYSLEREFRHTEIVAIIELATCSVCNRETYVTVVCTFRTQDCRGVSSLFRCGKGVAVGACESCNRVVHRIVVASLYNNGLCCIHIIGSGGKVGVLKHKLVDGSVLAHIYLQIVVGTR